jgi:hypothetical protein
MSAFMPDEKPAERQPSSPQKGPEAYLSPDERKALQRSLSFPEDIPPKFRSWLLDFIAVNGLELPVSQIRGYLAFLPKYAIVAGPTGNVSSTSYEVHEASTGPSIEIAGGRYLLLYGAREVTHSGNDGAGLMSPKVGTEAPADGYAVIFKTSVACNLIYFRFIDVREPLTTVSIQYRVTDGTQTFSGIYLMAIKIGN